MGTKWKIPLPSRGAMALILLGVLLGGGASRLASSSDIIRALLGIESGSAAGSQAPPATPTPYELRDDPEYKLMEGRVRALEDGMIRMEGKLDVALGLAPRPMSWADRDRPATSRRISP